MFFFNLVKTYDFRACTWDRSMRMAAEAAAQRPYLGILGE